MKILILGLGLLGSELKKVFANYNLTCWDIAELDITDFKKTRENIFDLKPDVIFNTAAYTNVEKAEVETKLCFKVNAEAVKNLAQIAFKIKTRFFHLSTDYVFDGKKKDGYQESDVPENPVNFYGLSKLAAENYVREISNNFQIPGFYIIRTSYVFGQNGKNFVSTMISLSQKLSEIKVVSDQFSCPTYAPDLAQAIKELSENKNCSGGIFHRTNQGIINFFNYAKEIFQIKKEIDKSFNIPKIIPIKLNQYSSAVKRPQYSILINTKLKPLRHYKEALKEYLK